MNIEDFKQVVRRHSIRPEGSDRPELYSINALMGELGELANVLKKEQLAKYIPEYAERVREETERGEREPIHKQKIDEAGDVLFYFLQYLNSEGIALDEVMQFQKNKLEDQSDEAGRMFLK